MSEAGAPHRRATIFRVLGRLEAVRDGTVLDLGPTKQRALLAMLLCKVDSVVATGTLIKALWPDDPPPSAHKNLQSYASGLRRSVVRADPDCQLTHRAPGYQISVPPDRVDLRVFENLVREGRSSLRAGCYGDAVRSLRAAIRQWREPALEEFSAFPALRSEAERLESRRLTAYEDLIEAELEQGSAEAVLEEIDELCWAHPIRERLRALQMTALHRSGRQAEALSVFDDVRQRLARELGLSPGPALQVTYRTVLGDTGRAASGGSGRSPVGVS